MPVHVQTPSVTLPYPGLRPFRRDEFEVFFGREEQVERLAEMLQSNHFIAVVGPSGCGKSSLVTAGLLPELADGHVFSSAGKWHEVIIRPGDRPFARLAEAIVACDMMPSDPEADVPSRIGFLDAFLRRGPLGLIETISNLAPLNGGNLLIVVDQFEEIFRYRKEAGDQEADAFVALLLESVRQAQIRHLPIYIMLTMRSDYFGDCNQFSGLPEEISKSQFLTPRPNREQRHAAIVGPAAMFGGDVEPALVNRLLNDMGDDPDQLPIMQHALMRMWSLKGNTTTPGEDGGDSPLLTTELYEKVGAWKGTLSQHADEAFNELGEDPTIQRTAEIMFRCLTQPGSEQNDVRRPVSVLEVARAAGVTTDVVRDVAAVFRRSDRSLVMPALPEGETSGDDLSDDDILDISHESLIRQWNRLRDWTVDEAESAATYRRLEDLARRWKAGLEAFLQSPGLDITIKWRETGQPTAAWAQRYGSDFETAMDFLEKSQDDKRRRDDAEDARRTELAAERARADQQTKSVVRVRRLVIITGIMAILFAISTIWAIHNSDMAKEQTKLLTKETKLLTEQKDRAEKLTLKANELTREANEQTKKAKISQAQAEKIAADLKAANALMAQQRVETQDAVKTGKATEFKLQKQNAADELNKAGAEKESSESDLINQLFELVPK